MSATVLLHFRKVFLLGQSSCTSHWNSFPNASVGVPERMKTMNQATRVPGTPGSSKAIIRIRKAARRRIPPRAVSVLPRRRTIDLSINTLKKSDSNF